MRSFVHAGLFLLVWWAKLSVRNMQRLVGLDEVRAISGIVVNTFDWHSTCLNLKICQLSIRHIFMTMPHLSFSLFETADELLSQIHRKHKLYYRP